MLSLPLPGRVQPHTDETILNWLYRLAWANHCSIDQLLRHVGVKRPRKGQEEQSNWEAFQKPFSIYVEGFPKRLPDKLDGFYGLHAQSGRDRRSIKVCTRCLQTQGVVTYRMQAIYTLACTKHGALLRSVCPHCGKDFRVQTSQRKDPGGCPSCQIPYAEMEVSPAPESLLHYQQQLNEESWSGGLDYANFQELAFRFGRTQRFMDTFHDALGRLDASPFHIKVYRRRTALLLALSEIVGLRGDLYSATREIFAEKFGYLATGQFGRLDEILTLRQQIISALHHDTHEKAAELVTPPLRS